MSPPSQPTKRHPLVRVLKGIAWGVGALLGLIAVAVAVVLLFPSLILGPVNGALKPVVQGQIMLLDVKSLSLDGARGVDADIVDPKGAIVARVRDVSAEIDVVALVRQLLSSSTHLHVELPRIRAGYVDLLLEPDAQDNLGLAEALTPPPSNSPPSRTTLSLKLGDILVEHAWVHGTYPDQRHLDLDLDKLRAWMRYEDDWIFVEDIRAVGQARAPLPGPLQLEGDVRLSPFDEESQSDGVVDPLLGVDSDSRAELRIGETSLSATLHRKNRHTRAKIDLHLATAQASTLGLSLGAGEKNENVALDLRILLAGTAADAHARVLGTIAKEEVEVEARLEQKVEVTTLSGSLRTRELSLAHFGVDGLGPLSSDLDWSATHDQAKAFENVRSFRAKLAGQVQSFSAFDHRIPELGVGVTLAQGELRTELRTEAAGQQGSTGKLTVGNLVKAQLTLESDGSISEGSAQADLDAVWLNLLDDRLRVDSGRVRAEGTMDARAEVLQARVEGSIFKLSWADQLEAERLDLNAWGEGDLSDPSVTGEVTTNQLVVGDRRFDELTVSVQGSLSSALVAVAVTSQDRTLRMGARVGFEGEVFHVQNADLSLEAPRTQVGIMADSVRVGGDGIHFEGLRTRGSPEDRLSGSYSANTLELEGNLRDLAIGKLTETLGIDGVPVDGIVSLYADARLRPGYVLGRVHLAVSWLMVKKPESLVLPPLQVALDVVGTGPEMDLVLDLDRQDGMSRPPYLDLSLRSRVPGIADFTAPIGLFKRLESLDARGALDLALTRAFLPEDISVEGQLNLDLHLARTGAESGDLSLVDVRIQSHGLVVSAPLSKEKSAQSQGTSPEKLNQMVLEGTELVVGISYDQGSKTTQLLAEATRENQTFCSARVETRESPLVMIQMVPSRMLSLPFEAEVWLPDRDLSTWPELLRPSFLQGRVGGHAEVRGRLDAPRAELELNLEELKFDSQENTTEALARRGSLSATYDGTTLEVRSQTYGGKRTKLNVAASLRAPWDRNALLPEPQKLDALVDIERFPLRLLPAMSHRSVEGAASAHVKISDWGTADRKVESSLTLEDAHVDTSSISGAQVKFSVEDEEAQLQASVSSKDYRVELRGAAQLAPDSLWIPTLGKDLEGDLEVEDFPLELLRPFVGASVAELSGTLNAQAHASRQGEQSVMEGKLQLEDGSFQIPQLGQRISQVDVELTWEPNGRLLVKDASFHGATGKGTFDLEGQMDVYRPKDLHLRLAVDRPHRLPLSMAGLGLGEFWADIKTDVAFDYEQRHIDVSTRVDEFQLRFPELPTTSVQSLGDAEGIHVGTGVAGDHWIEFPLQPISSDTSSESPWSVLVKVDLGKKFWLQQGPTRQVQLAGEVRIDAAEEVRPSGQVRVPTGRIELNGRMFEVRRGTLTFQEKEPDNPILIAEAQWMSPEGIAVIARFSGPVKDGEMTLTSDPTLPEDQVLSLLLFGDTAGLSDLGADQPESASGSQAAQVGGSFVAQGLNRALGRIDVIDVSTRVKSGDSGNVRPEVVVQLTNSLSAQLGYNLEEPAPGKSPDRTLLSLELRVVGGHSLSATVGDRGSSLLDWVWRYKY